MTLPTLGRIVHYRSKTGKYTLAAIVTATVDTLFRLGVEEGHLPDLTDATHVHLGVFTPGLAGHRNSTTTEDVGATLTARSVPAGGSYQEWDVPEDQTGEKPGSWRWPPRD